MTFTATQEWAYFLFTHESRFSTQCDCRQNFMLRVRCSRYHPSNTREIGHFGGANGIFLSKGIILGGSTTLYTLISVLCDPITTRCSTIFIQHLFDVERHSERT
ncbi:hypothetical protein AVEN_175555-1 [Araneus ventricosus]|uniref:Uncharacterized protein n=1 Tax=Araneus ventricosus TaxID=182803 RepID=A0A4Y2CMR6_ARAVE|nr:hypothetical protein AVEN_175555-1 [Araneus ventricosus]